MKAVVLEGPDKELVYTDVKEPSPGENEVAVELKTAALNRTRLLDNQRKISWYQVSGYTGI
ncbi:MAG: hypothetical protein R2784_12215 [Saprospiraceae bacterium]